MNRQAIFAAGRSRRAAKRRTLRAGRFPLRMAAERLESRQMLAADPWVAHNSALPEDVNHDGNVSPLDAVLVINALNSTAANRALASADSGSNPPRSLDVNNDAFVSPVDALMVINAISLPAEGQVLAIEVRLEVVDLASGEPVTVAAFAQGAPELLGVRAWVRDLAGTTTGGVRKGYFDLNWDNELFTIAGDIEFSSQFPNGRSGTIMGMMVDELGASDGTTPTGPDETLMLTIPIQTSAVGEVQFSMDSAEGAGHDFELYDVIGPIDPADVDFLGLTLSVVPGHRPVGVDDQYNATTGIALVVPVESGVLSNDTDGDDDDLTVVVDDLPEHGTLSANADGSFTYSPEAGYVGPDSFTYRASDGTFNSFLTTVVLEVGEENLAPIGLADAFAVDQNQILVVEAAQGVLSNDSDPEGSPLTAVLSSDPEHGDLVLQPDGGLTYVPDTGFAGTDTFTYVANDGTLDSEPVTVTITVNEGPQEPLVGFILELVDVQGNPITSIPAGGQFRVRAIVDDLRVEAAEAGVFSAYMDLLFDPTLVQAAGDIQFSQTYSNRRLGELTEPGLFDEVGALDGLTPLGPDPMMLFEIPFSALAIGSALFETDLADIGSNEVLLFGDADPLDEDQIDFGSVTLEITEGGGPTAEDDAYEADEDVTLIVPAVDGVLSNDVSEDEEAVLTAELVTQAQHGTVTLAEDGGFSYIPEPNFNGVDTFTYVASDGELSSNVATVTITVAPSPDPPIGVEDDYLQLTPNEPLVIDVAEGVLSNDINVDDPGGPLTAELVTTATRGELELADDGSFTYQPEQDFVGVDSFTYRAVDEAGQRSQVTTVTLIIGDVAAPSIIAGSVYFDFNNNGLREPHELGLAGVPVTITGMDVFGGLVDMTVVTERDGRYSIPDLFQGSYMLTQGEVGQVVDGIDSAPSVEPEDNNAISLTLLPGVTVNDVNFAERGLMSPYITNAMFVNNRVREGVIAGLGTNLQQGWHAILGGWNDFRRVEVGLSDDLMTVTITAENFSGQVFTGSERVDLTDRVRVLGNSDDGYVVRLEGPSSAFDLQLTGNVGLSAPLVDAAFQL